MPKAITATAYKLARILYATLSTGDAYANPGQDYYERANKDCVLKRLARHTNELGYQLVQRRPAPALAPPS